MEAYRWRTHTQAASVWEIGSAKVEIAQGKAMADAAVATGAELIVWSSLPNVTEMSNGKLSGVKNVKTFLPILSGSVRPDQKRD